MDLEATLRSFSALADPSARRHALDVLAREIDAAAVRLAIPDLAHPSRFVAPAGTPGWPDTASWNAVLERCTITGRHAGSLASPGDGSVVPAVAYAFPQLAIIVVGHRDPDAGLAHAFEVCAPLLAALLRAEQQVVAMRQRTLTRIGHDLREPLAPIASAVQLLRLETATPTRVHDILERQVTHLLRLVDNLIAEGERQTASSQRPSSTSTGVLVVDDNHDAADLLGTLLTTLGYAVRVAHDGLEGLALIDEFTPDVALLDIGLPGMDGYELAGALHARLPALPLIAITGYGQDKDRARAREAGFSAHLVKPVSIASLSDVLDELVPGKR